MKHVDVDVAVDARLNSDPHPLSIAQTRTIFQANKTNEVHKINVDNLK